LSGKARFPEGFYKVGFDLVLNGRNHGCGGDRFGFGESIEQELRTEVVVTMGMGDVNGDEILATLDDPIQQIPRVLRGQKRINEYGITLLMREFAEPDRDWARTCVSRRFPRLATGSRPPEKVNALLIEFLRGSE